MSSTIDRHQLEALLAELPPDEIFRRHGESFDDECRALWQEFMAFDEELQALSDNLARLTPAAPEMATAKPATSRPWWQRRIDIPAWSLPLAAMAAALVLMILSIPSNRGEEEEVLLKPTRDFPFDSNYQAHAAKLYDALMDVGLDLFNTDDPEIYRSALFYFEQAFALKPEEDRPLNYMIIIADSLKDRRLIKKYQAMQREYKVRNPQ